MRWFEWIGLFKTLVHDTSNAPEEKLAILKKSLKGPCTNIVRGNGEGENAYKKPQHYDPDLNYFGTWLCERATTYLDPFEIAREQLGVTSGKPIFRTFTPTADVHGKQSNGVSIVSKNIIYQNVLNLIPTIVYG